MNPIAICLDERGRVYVAEDHRFLEGTPENRTHDFMLEDDLQITTLADRLAMQRKWAGKFDKGGAWFTQKSDIVRRLEDEDGNGRADASHVFADGFDGPLDGLGSGLIARDGNQGLAMAEREDPDLMFLDMMMPKRSGFLVLEKLRRTRLVPLRVIMITANEGSRHKAYAEMLGVDDYIRKPFSMDRLVESVNRLLAG